MNLKAFSLVLLAAATAIGAATPATATPLYDCGDNYLCLWDNTTFRGFQISQGAGRGFCIEELGFQSLINHIPLPVTVWRNPDCTGTSQTFQPNTASPNLGAFYYGVTM